jgi:hypothetical protein
MELDEEGSLDIGGRPVSVKPSISHKFIWSFNFWKYDRLLFV